MVALILPDMIRFNDQNLCNSDVLQLFNLKLKYLFSPK